MKTYIDSSTRVRPPHVLRDGERGPAGYSAPRDVIKDYGGSPTFLSTSANIGKSQDRFFGLYRRIFTRGFVICQYQRIEDSTNTNTFRWDWVRKCIGLNARAGYADKRSDNFPTDGASEPLSASEETANSHDRVASACLAESLPEELIILIVSHIRSKKDLRSFSTVCRSWSFPAQSRLFSTLAIEYPYEVKTWIIRFQSFPHICHAVKRIDFSGYEPGSRKLAQKLLKKLPNVKEVITVYWNPESVRILRKLKKLERLSLYGVSYGDLANITLGIRKMGYLKSLDISVEGDVTWSPSLLPEKTSKGPLKLRALGVMLYADTEEDTDGSIRHMLDWLCSAVFDHSEVQTLNLVWEDIFVWDENPGVEVERLGCFFNALNPQLENLVLTLPGGDTSDDEPSDDSDSEILTLSDGSDSEILKLDPFYNYLLGSKALSKFTNLKTLTMHPVPEGVVEFWTGIEKALALLETLREYPLHTIHLSLDLVRNVSLTNLPDHLGNLVALNKLFEESDSDKMPSFPSLKGFYFHVHTTRYRDSDSMVRAMKDIMCELEKRDVLHVEILKPRSRYDCLYRGGRGELQCKYDHSEVQTLSLVWEDILLWDQDLADLAVTLSVGDTSGDESDDSDSEILKLDPFCDYLLMSAEALSKFTNLKMLTIRSISDWYIGISTGIKKALVILEALRTSLAHTIHLSLYLVARLMDLEVVAFNTLFEYSSSDKMPSFPNLKRFYFHLHTSDLKLAAAMKDIMSELEKRNVLHFEILEPRIFGGWKFVICQADGASELLSASEETANSHDRVASACLAESLPEELITLIVSHIRSESDLRSCSTVCRSWSFPAQSRLFSTLAIDYPYEVKTWIKRFQSSPHICHLVKKINFSEYEPGSRAQKLLKKIPNVKEVVTEYWNPESVRMLKRLKNLERLSLYRVTEGDLANVTLMTRKMGCLKSLDISVEEDVTWTPSLLPDKALKGPLKLKALGVMLYADTEEDTDESIRHMLDWLCSPVFDHSEVQALNLVWEDIFVWDQRPTGVEVERLGCFFNALNPQLENLVLTLPQGNRSGEESDPELLTLDPFYNHLLVSKTLSKFTNLKTLAILPNRFLEFWTGIGKVLALLKTLRESPVHTIHLSLDFCKDVPLTDLPDHLGKLVALNKLFEDSGSNKIPSFPNLKGFHFHVHAVCYRDSDSMVRAMKDIMCELEKREVLHVKILKPRYVCSDGFAGSLQWLQCL
ncbi:hypothetical protein K435DRAFT_873454 [Dendrothele bispora CBS 962.96]|uniref:F-box domain-containing protein n=1 Tax=Dendrothele bispora (strain CBS 962.96) TaxID=1314807 RepID=A0A4V4HC10_DENBC|nr:hypothetical protein K435DRAFT_873454 [Dendrothele bispora CBS 962.96]